MTKTNERNVKTCENHLFKYDKKKNNSEG